MEGAWHLMPPGHVGKAMVQVSALALRLTGTHSPGPPFDGAWHLMPSGQVGRAMVQVSARVSRPMGVVLATLKRAPRLTRRVVLAKSIVKAL